jgi:hypothetical protein
VDLMENKLIQQTPKMVYIGTMTCAVSAVLSVLVGIVGFFSYWASLAAAVLCTVSGVIFVMTTLLISFRSLSLPRSRQQCYLMYLPMGSYLMPPSSNSTVEAERLSLNTVDGASVPCGWGQAVLWSPHYSGSSQSIGDGNRLGKANMKRTKVRRLVSNKFHSSVSSDAPLRDSSVDFPRTKP